MNKTPQPCTSKCASLQETSSHANSSLSITKTYIYYNPKVEYLCVYYRKLNWYQPIHHLRTSQL